jgi:hypothetical protein
VSFPITERTRQAASQLVKQPNVVLCIDGVDTKYGSANILQIIRIGDPGLLIDGSWVIGGYRDSDDQLVSLSLDESTTSIKQQLDIDKGRGSGISSMEIGLIDFDENLTQLISPGVVVTDVLGRKAKVYLGFVDESYPTSFPEDYVVIMRGVIDDIKAEAGMVKFNIAHPDQKKRQNIFTKVTTALNGALNNSDTTINVDSTTNYLLRTNGPDGSPDTSFTSYIRIDDEIIAYTGVTATSFTGCTRGSLGTTAATHDNDASVDSYYTLTGNCVDLALKIMLSGWQGYFTTGVDVTNFNILGDASVLDNSMFFNGVNLEVEYGLTVGDYVTTTGATNGANNVSLKTISEIVVDDLGTYLVIDNVTFVNEASTVGTVSFRSKYDSLPSGLKLSPDEVDVAEHERIYTLFLSSHNYLFYLKESIENAQEFLEQQIYKPAGAYSLPRKARCSMGYFIGPIPGSSTITIDDGNVTNPDKLKIRRTINKNFFNTIVYKFEIDPLEDKFLRGVITQSATSLSQIPVGARALVVEAEGMRESLTGVARATAASNRRLDRFKFGAEFLEGVQLTYEYGFNLEIGDIVILDGTNLQLSDTATGERGKAPKFFEIINKSMSVKTGSVVLDLVDTNFSGQARYGLVAPASKIKSGISTTVFEIEKVYRSNFGVNEYKKWERYPLCAVKIVSEDFTTRNATAVITGISGNRITVSPALGFTPQNGDIMTLANYDNSNVTEQIKLLYVHMTNGSSATFASDGRDAYSML